MPVHPLASLSLLGCVFGFEIADADAYFCVADADAYFDAGAYFCVLVFVFLQGM
jgi:hypothetical protein